MYWSILVAASLSMLAFMVSSHLLTSLEALSDGALFSSGLVVLGVNASWSAGGMKVLDFLVEEGERGISVFLLVPVGELGAADWDCILALWTSICFSRFWI